MGLNICDLTFVGGANSRTGGDVNCTWILLGVCVMARVSAPR